VKRRIRTRALAATSVLSALVAAALGYAAIRSADVAREAAPVWTPPAETVPMGESVGVFYEIFVRSFRDSDGDGIGDLNGVTASLDYLADLGVRGIWLMPIQPAASYHGYDVTDYYGIHPDYGTMEDFRRLVAEAHRRGIRVILDLVLNHTSDKHPWFREAAEGSDNPRRDWYVWAEDQGIEPTEPGPWGQKVWHRIGGSFYLGVFWEKMPDLNPDNPEVRAEWIRIGQFWLKLGVDGFRLDAAKHIYENFRSSVGDRLTTEKNTAWWREFRRGLDEVNPNAYLVGEVWDSPAVIGPYLNGAFDSAFNFELANRLVGTARAERASTVVESLSKVLAYYSSQSGGRFVDAPFLTNHDQNRVMSELGGRVGRAKIAASLLLTMPGNPFLYYGEELGMRGTKPDERIREPMPWSEDGRSDGDTRWEPALNRTPGVSVEKQRNDPDSLLNHYRKMIALRNREPLLQNGGIARFPLAGDGVLGYVRFRGDDRLLVVHNLTGLPQRVDLWTGGRLPFRKIAFASEKGARLSRGRELELPPYATVLMR